MTWGLMRTSIKLFTALPIAALLFAGASPAFASDDEPVIAYQSQGFYAGNNSPVTSITPSDRFYFLYRVDNQEPFPIKLVSATLNLAMAKPECDAYLTAENIGDDSFPKLLGPGLSDVFTDSGVWTFSSSTPSSCQGLSIKLNRETVAFRIPSEMTAIAVDHVEGGQTRFTATVETEWIHANGRVQFYVDGVPYGDPVTLDSTATPAGAQASAALEIPESDIAVGPHTLVAEYLPAPDAPASSLSVEAPFTVSPKPTVTPPPTTPPTTPPAEIDPPTTGNGSGSANTDSGTGKPNTGGSADALASTGASQAPLFGAAAVLATLGVALFAVRTRRAARANRLRDL